MRDIKNIDIKNIEQLANEWYERWKNLNEDSSLEVFDEVDYLSEKICLLVAEKYIGNIDREYE